MIKIPGLDIEPMTNKNVQKIILNIYNSALYLARWDLTALARRCKYKKKMVNTRTDNKHKIAATTYLKSFLLKLSLYASGLLTHTNQ